MSTLPIRVREILRRDGTRVRSLHVFCPRERASIAPEVCARCDYRCPPEDGKRAPAVGCAADVEGPASAPVGILCGPDAAAWRVAAGAASARRIVCVLAETPMGVARRELAGEPVGITVPVVDASGAYVGMLPLVAVTVAMDHRPEALLPVADAMEVAVAMDESAPLGELIASMATHHLRQVPMTGAGGELTGVVSDLDLLRWVARGAPSRWW
jgi:CBS domain-containing protein